MTEKRKTKISKIIPLKLPLARNLNLEPIASAKINMLLLLKDEANDDLFMDQDEISSIKLNSSYDSYTNDNTSVYLEYFKKIYNYNFHLEQV